MLSEAYRQLDNVTAARRVRLGLGRGIVPGVVWAGLAVGAVITVGFTYFFGTKSRRAQAAMTGLLAGLIFWASS